MKKKVLITSVSRVGAGHVKAAEALLTYGKEHCPGLDFCYLDIMEHIGKTMKHTIVQTYDVLAKHAPELWGFFYDTINTPQGGHAFNAITKPIKQIQAKKYYQAVE